jgi:hypothetical protein
VDTGRELPAALNPKHTDESFIFSNESFVPKVEDDGEKQTNRIIENSIEAGILLGDGQFLRSKNR